MPRHLKQLCALQMIGVLIALTNVVSQHAANQALLVSLAEPLLAALAAWLSTFPSTTTLETTDAPEASLTSVPVNASTAQSASAARENSRTKEESTSTPPPTVHYESSITAQKVATSALTARLKGPKQPSLLTAKLKGRSRPTKADTLDPSASISLCGPPQDTVSSQRVEFSKRSERREDSEVQLAKRFIYHLLLHLPVGVLKGRQAFWMEHAVGLPELMQSCLGVAVVQAPTVSHYHLVQTVIAAVTAPTSQSIQCCEASAVI